MSKSDFFSFCTALKPVELRALGELSHVEHLPEGVTVYSSGDPGDAFFIINRGAVAVIHEDPRYSDRADISYLSRGDMFGELEVLTGSPRRTAIRTCEEVSLQCFSQDSFPKLIQKVPAFFHYLAQRLAARFVQVTDVAFIQSHCLELSGNLQNFDLVTIYQTIVNSSQTGELAIFNEVGEAVAVFYFQEGRPMQGQYYSLSGEEAFFQLFLHEKLHGTFAFSLVEAPDEEGGAPPEPIHRSSTDLLITALQYRDEFRAMLAAIPDSSIYLYRLADKLEWRQSPEMDPALKTLAIRLWNVASAGPLSVDDLFQHLQVCEFRLYKVILHLLDTGHFALSARPPDSQSTAA